MMRKAAILLISFLIAVSAFAGGKSVLDNGVRFIEINRDYTETLSVVFFVRGGTVRETPVNNGVGSLFSSVWVKSSDLLKEIEFYGGGVYSSVGTDFVETTFSIPVEFFDKLIDDYEKFVTEPKIDKKIFENDKTLQKEGIKAAEDNPDSRSFKGFMAATYNKHPYGMNSEGTLESVDKITAEDLERYGKELLQGTNITVAVAGKYTAGQIKRLKAVFGKLPAGKPFKIECDNSSIQADSRIEDNDEGLQQAKLFVGYTAPSASEKDYAAVKLMSDILGGGMSSRYFNVLRKDKGYAYSVGAAYPSRICKSRFIAHIGLAVENVPDAIDTIERLNKEFINDLTEEEMDAVRNYVLGRILIDSQTNAKQAWYACFFENTGLGSEYFNNYINILKEINIEDIKKAARLFNGPKTVYLLK
ncbi:M16 family metallopeptidase [Deferribacteres bacterium DY0037]